jgi:SH3-like domain-containing protein
MKRLITGLLIIFALTVTVARAEMVSISGIKVNMRSGPGAKHEVLWELGRGYPLQVIDRKGNWLKVTDFENDTGWVYRKLTARSPHMIVNVYKDKKLKVNIRTGPGTDYKIIGKAFYGVVFKTMKRGEDWVKVQHENGVTGWVKRNQLWGW